MTDKSPSPQKSVS